MRYFWVVLLLCLSYALSTTSEAATYCVDINGSAAGACNASASGDCTDVTVANRETRIGDDTEAGAQSCLSPGDTIIVFPGTYTVHTGIGDEMHIENSGTSPSNRTTIKGSDPNNKPVFNFGFTLNSGIIQTETNCSQYWNQSPAQVHEYWEFRDLDIVGDDGVNTNFLSTLCSHDIKLNGIIARDNAQGAGAICWTTDGDRTFKTCDVFNSKFHGNLTNGLKIEGTGALIEGNEIYNNGVLNFHCIKCTDPVVRYNVFHDCAGTRCLEATGNNGGWYYGNIFYSCGGDFCMKVLDDGVTVANNTFYSATSGLYMRTEADSTIVKNNIFDNVTDEIRNDGTNTTFDNNIADSSDVGIETVAEVLLVDPGNATASLKDFNVGAGSPAINAGSTTAGVDLTGNGVLDAGAIESPIFSTAFAVDAQTVHINMTNNRLSPVSACDKNKITVDDQSNTANPASCTISTNQLILDMTGTSLDPMTSGETLTFTTTYGYASSTSSIGTYDWPGQALALTSPQSITNQIGGGGPPTTTLTQRIYRWDDPTQSIANATKALYPLAAEVDAENEPLTLPASGGALLRIKIDATVGNPNPFNLKLEFRKNAESYADIGTDCAMADACISTTIAPNIVSMEAVTEELTTSARTYVNGEVVTDANSISVDMAQDEDREYVYPIRLAGGLTLGDTYDFRVKTFDTYTVTPQIVIGPQTWGFK